MLDERLIQHPGKLFLDGRWAEPSTSATIDLLNCATEALVETVAEAEDADVERAVAAAREAFDRGPWPRMSHEERATYMRAMADELDRRADRHARIWTTESGLLQSHSRSRMQGLSDTYRFYADLAGTFPFQERHKPQSGGAVALLVREPVGVVAAIVPWNGAPGLIAVQGRPGADRRLHGHRSRPRRRRRARPTSSPRPARQRACPPGVVNVLTADREVSEMLVRAPGRRQGHLHRLDRRRPPDRLALRRAHRARARSSWAASRPAIVLDDSDVDAAAPGARRAPPS